MTIDPEALFASLMKLPKATGREILTIDGRCALVRECGDLAVCATNGSGGRVIFSRGLPWLSETCSLRWVGDCWFCFLQGIPSQRMISIVSSRLRQRLDLEKWWFDLLRTLILQCDADAETLVVATGTAPYEASKRAAQLFGKSMIRFEASTESSVSDSEFLRPWVKFCWQQIIDSQEDQRDPPVFRVLVSPALELPGPTVSDGALSKLPLGDRLLFAAANRIHVFSCRNQGVVAELLTHHIHDEERRNLPLLVAADESGQLPKVVETLPNGWIPWLLEPCKPPALDRAGETPLMTTPVWPEDLSSPLLNPDDWLLHWTRAKVGPWPGESPEDFLDAAILQTESADHSALTTLLRIISDQCIRSSSDGIRGGHAVVAFTAVPLHEFRSRRVFRKHRNRFDFEPWGIAIHKSQLQQRAVRPVLYGNDQDWTQLSPEDQPYFQKSTLGGATSNSAELEWRVMGDLDLSQFDRKSIFVFVDNSAAADLVSQHSRWPVLVVSDNPASSNMC